MERQAFTISRATWWRGQSAMGSKLLIRDATSYGLPAEANGKMCCLGSIAIQCGATMDQIAGVESPSRLYRNRTALAAFAPLVTNDVTDDWSCNSKIATELMATNDSDRITDTEREAKLTALAATIGWDLTFVD